MSLLTVLLLACMLGADEKQPEVIALVVGDTHRLDRKDVTVAGATKEFSAIAEVRADRRDGIKIIARAPGSSTFDVKDRDGKVETLHVVVYRPVLLPLDRPKLLRMTSGQPIQVAQPRSPDLEAQLLKDNPSTVAVRTKKAEDAALILVGKDGSVEPVLLYCRSDRVPGKDGILMRPGDSIVLEPPGLGEIKSASNTNDTVARLFPNLPNGVSLTALAPGVASLQLVDVKDRKVVMELVVAPRAPIHGAKDLLRIAAGKPIRLQTASKQPVRMVDITSATGPASRTVFKSAPGVNDKANAGRFELRALEPGIYHFFICDVDGKEERYKVLVEEDKE